MQWQEHERSLCGGCGQPLHESTLPDLEGAYEVTALACHACAERESKQPDYKDQHGVKLAVHLSADARRWLDEQREDC